MSPHDRIELLRMSRLESVTGEEFRRVCGRFASGVTVATVLDANGTPHGLTVSSFTSVSLDPPLILICLGHAVTVIDYFRAARYFGINVLKAEHHELSNHFARKGHDRFGNTPWHAGITGVPLLDDTLAAMECETEQRFTAGDHDIFVGRMVRALVSEGQPLVHYTGRYRRLAID